MQTLAAAVGLGPLWFDRQSGPVFVIFNLSSWVWFGAADHPGTVTLDERGGTFAGPGFTGSFEGGILQPLVVRKGSG